MRYILTFLLLVVVLQAYTQVKDAEVQIAETVRALPESFREGATVIGYNQTGEHIELRKGTNDMICWADDPNLTDAKGEIFVVCFPKSLEPYMTRLQELTLKGVSNIYDTVDNEIEAGKIPMPKLAVRYTLRGHSPDGALPLTVIHVPFATAESTGFSTEIDNFRPWLMWPGTANAHIMVPGH
jgi:hypothetical protein